MGIAERNTPLSGNKKRENLEEIVHLGRKKNVKRTELVRLVLTWVHTSKDLHHILSNAGFLYKKSL